MKDLLTPFLAGAGFVAACLVFFVIGKTRGYETGYQAALNEPVKADTVWRTDTHFVDRPVEVWRERERLVYIPVVDTQIVHTTDSVFVALERERRGYSGEDYEAVVSGIQPVLESIKVFPKTAYVTNTVVRQKHWGFGVSAGPGVLWDGKIHGGVGIVAGLTYQF